MSAQWLFRFLFSLLMPNYMVSSRGSYTFTFYAIFDIITATLVFLFVRETKGLSIEEIETIFHSQAAFDVEAVGREALKNGTSSQDGLKKVQVQDSKGEQDCFRLSSGLITTFPMFRRVRRRRICVAVGSYDTSV